MAKRSGAGSKHREAQLRRVSWELLLAQNTNHPPAPCAARRRKWLLCLLDAASLPKMFQEPVPT